MRRTRVSLGEYNRHDFYRVGTLQCSVSTVLQNETPENPVFPIDLAFGVGS
jgi:hypothetical protein